MSSDKIDPLCYEDIERVAEAIKAQIKLKEVPTVGIICGSGLGDLGEMLENPQILPYNKIPGFEPTNVEGHKGNLIFGYLEGKYVMCVQGRFHPYEHGMNLALCAMPVRVMHFMGVKTLIVTNAAGSVRHDYRCGDIMLIKDHIFLPGLAGFSPLVGCNDPRFGVRFVSVHAAYDPQLRTVALEIGRKQGIRVHEGIFLMAGGPQFESLAEEIMCKTIGADALGMSTCHEVTVARQCRMRVLGFSLITDVSTLKEEAPVEIKHEEVLEMASEASERVCTFVAAIVKAL